MNLSFFLLTILPTIWIVDASNGPGTNFTDLPAAVSAASSGDTIIVRAGFYTSFTASGKALTIRGAGAATTIVGSVAPPGSPYLEPTIENVPAGATFYVGGLRLSPSAYPAPLPPPPQPSLALRIQGAATRVVIADVTILGPTIQGALSSSITTGGPGLYVSGGAEVHASRCTFTGGFGTQSGGAGAVVWIGSNLIVEASTFTGGGGGAISFNGPGGMGLGVAGTASTSHCSFYGGMGGGGGGDAIALFAIGAFARIAASAADVVQPAGVGFPGGPPGYALSAPPGTTAIVHGVPNVILPPGGSAVFGSATAGPPLPFLTITGTAVPGGDLQASQPVTVTLDGLLPGAPFVFAIDVSPSFSTAFAPLLLGPLLVPVPPMLVFEGALDALGMATVGFTPAVNAPFLVDVPIYFQFGVLDSSIGQVRLSNGPVRIFKS